MHQMSIILINLLIGPPLFRWALIRAGEARPGTLGGSLLLTGVGDGAGGSTRSAGGGGSSKGDSGSTSGTGAVAILVEPIPHNA